MNKLIDGKIVEMTPEEIKELQDMTANAPQPPPSPEGRIAELEAQLSSMAAAYQKGVNEA